MFFWRRKSDGFDWHKHVRTTIRIRRAVRRERMEVARLAAVDGLKGVGRAGVAVGSGGLALAGQWSTAAFAALQAGLIRSFEAIPPIAARMRAAAAVGLRASCGLIRTPGVQPLLMLVGIVAIAAAVIRFTGTGLTADAAFTFAVGLATLLVAAIPLLMGEQALPRRAPGYFLAAIASRLRDVGMPSGIRFPASLSGKGIQLASVAVAVLVLASAALGGGWLVWYGATRLVSTASIAGLIAQKVDGRAVAVTGDVLRIGDSEVRLAGIEAPDASQRCSRPGDRRWRCGAAARAALAQLVGSTSVNCTISGADTSGRALGTCVTKGNDLAEALVREGHVFAETGLFSKYAALEEQAKSEKIGLWRGEAERPSEYRARLAERMARAWDAASRTAPGGCPIKGRVVSGRKYYVLPGTVDYDRVRIRARRGERWFCSEEEAAAEGWKRSPRS